MTTNLQIFVLTQLLFLGLHLPSRQIAVLCLVLFLSSFLDEIVNNSEHPQLTNVIQHLGFFDILVRYNHS